jgi:hypothetical protein
MGVGPAHHNFDFHLKSLYYEVTIRPHHHLFSKKSRGGVKCKVGTAHHETVPAFPFIKGGWGIFRNVKRRVGPAHH